METETVDKRPTQNVFEFGDFNSEDYAYGDTQHHNFLLNGSELKVTSLNMKIEQLEKILLDKDNEIDLVKNKIDMLSKENFDLKEQLEVFKTKDEINEVC